MIGGIRPVDWSCSKSSVPPTTQSRDAHRPTRQVAEPIHFDVYCTGRIAHEDVHRADRTPMRVRK